MQNTLGQNNIKFCNTSIEQEYDSNFSRPLCGIIITGIYQQINYWQFKLLGSLIVAVSHCRADGRKQSVSPSFLTTCIFILFDKPWCKWASAWVYLLFFTPATAFQDKTWAWIFHSKSCIWPVKKGFFFFVFSGFFFPPSRLFNIYLFIYFLELNLSFFIVNKAVQLCIIGAGWVFFFVNKATFFELHNRK